ncbi:MAG: Fic family protein [Acidimicrobiaceae bacterium]|nr:Fic family protein [Acidimicrobiaceae bacterium]
MRPESFKSTERGTVCRALEGFWAFHPKPLPHRIDLDNETVRLLDQATAAVNRLGGVGLLLPNPRLLIGPYLRIEAVLSSRIEGTQTDVPQLLRLEADRLTSPEQTEDAREVANYVVALEHGLSRVRDGFPISVRLMREMHEYLLKGVRGHHRTPGELRKSPVWIGGDTLGNAIFVPPPPDIIQDALRDLEIFIHKRQLPLLIQLALAHYQFEAIHPFLDGNGRLGRILIPLLLVERNVLPEPLLYLSAYFEQNRSEYYDLLLRTNQQGDLIPWLKFFLKGVRQQARNAEQRTHRLVKLQTDLRNQLLKEGRPSSVLRLAEHLFSLPIVTTRMVAELINVTAPTANTAIRALVERGDLQEISGRERYRLYQATEIFDAAYGPVEASSEDPIQYYE